MPLAIANRYALALAEVVSKTDSSVKPEQALAQLRQIRDLITGSQPLRTVLASPAVSLSRKRAVLGELANRLGVSQPVKNFLFVVIDHRRSGMMDEFAEAFGHWLDDKSGIARARVASAMPMDDAQKAGIIQRFETITAKRIEAEFETDPELLGGAVVRIGYNIYDGSLRAQLNTLNRMFAARG